MNTAKHEINALTGLRFIAAFWVFLYHLGDFFIQPLFPNIWPIYKFFFHGGGLGVDLFFILSGFVIAYNYFDKFSVNDASYWSFLYKRFSRIYPIHLFTMLLLFPFAYLLDDGNFFALGTINSFIRQIFLIHSLFPPVEWNVVSWSISSEWFAYVLFPVFVMFLKPFRSMYSHIALLIIIFFGSLLLITILLSNGIKFSHPAFWLIRIFSEFNLGILLFKIWCLKPQARLSLFQKNILLPVICLFLFFSSHLDISFVWMIPFLSYIIFLIITNQFFLNNFLAQPILIYGGKISYSLYMVHGMLMVVFLFAHPPENLVNADELVRAIFIITYIISTAALTIFSYHFIEQPSRKILLSMRKKT